MARKSVKKYKTHASVFIAGASKMTPGGRKKIAAWLRKQATMLTDHGKDYSSKFRGRYLSGGAATYD